MDATRWWWVNDDDWGNDNDQEVKKTNEKSYKQPGQRRCLSVFLLFVVQKVKKGVGVFLKFLFLVNYCTMRIDVIGRRWYVVIVFEEGSNVEAARWSVILPRISIHSRVRTGGQSRKAEHQTVETVETVRWIEILAKLSNLAWARVYSTSIESRVDGDEEMIEGVVLDYWYSLHSRFLSIKRRRPLMVYTS